MRQRLVAVLRLGGGVGVSQRNAERRVGKVVPERRVGRKVLRDRFQPGVAAVEVGVHQNMVILGDLVLRQAQPVGKMVGIGQPPRRGEQLPPQGVELLNGGDFQLGLGTLMVGLGVGLFAAVAHVGRTHLRRQRQRHDRRIVADHNVQAGDGRPDRVFQAALVFLIQLFLADFLNAEKGDGV